MVFPLKDIGKINERLEATEHLILASELRIKLVQSMRQCGDVERLVSKIPLRKINPREVLQLSRALAQMAFLKSLCAESTNPYMQRLAHALNPCEYITEKIGKSITENPPAVAAKGSFINLNVHDELDSLRRIVHGGKEYLLQLQQKEAAETGISSLKIGFNNVFGYYLEVTNLHKSKVPSAWMRKQTLANAERYITAELKEYEEKIVGAEEKMLQIRTGNCSTAL
jgi:DNA mismatch repair protein MutS